jgi:hypothetical protein
MPQSDVFTFLNAVCLGSVLLGGSYFLLYIYSFPSPFIKYFFFSKFVENVWLKFDLFNNLVFKNKEINFYYF